MNSLRSLLFIWAKWKPDKNAAPGNVFGWCYFDADESWHCVHLFDESTVNISQASSLCSRLHSPYLSPSTKTPSSKEQWEVSYTEPFKDLQPASIITHHRLLSSDTMIKNTEPLVVIFFNSCLSNLTSRLVHHHVFTQLPRATRLTPLSRGNQGPWGASQHRFEVERLKRKDLSNWDDEAKVGRGGGSVRGTGKAVNTERLGTHGIQLRARLF